MIKLKLKLKLLNANLTSCDKILCILHFTFSLFAIMPKNTKNINEIKNVNFFK